MSEEKYFPGEEENVCVNIHAIIKSTGEKLNTSFVMEKSYWKFLDLHERNDIVKHKIFEDLIDYNITTDLNEDGYLSKDDMIECFVKGATIKNEKGQIAYYNSSHEFGPFVMIDLETNEASFFNDWNGNWKMMPCL